jgi:hypothetical protein
MQLGTPQRTLFVRHKELTMSGGRLVEVYRAQNSPQAHLLRSALEDAGIHALIDGDLLQGAVGQIPAGWASAPRILVEESDAAHARQLLESWERSRPPTVPITGAPKQTVEQQGGYIVYAVRGLTPQFLGPFEKEADALAAAKQHTDQDGTPAVVLAAVAWYYAK